MATILSVMLDTINWTISHLPKLSTILYSALFLVVFVLWATKDIWVTFFKPIIRPSPLMKIRAPAGGDLMSGHMGYISQYAKYPDAWLVKVFATMGHVVRIRGPWNLQLLTTTDLKAIGHVLNNPQIYRKSDSLRWEFTTFIGDGVVVAEGEIHKRQRRIIQQAFGVSQIRDMCKDFVNKSIEVRKEIDKLIDEQNAKQANGTSSSSNEKERDSVVTDMVSWISRAALDIVGITGFGYDIGSVKNRDTDKDVLYPALEEVFVKCNWNFLVVFFKGWIPLLRLWKFDSASQYIGRAHEIMMDISKTVVDQRTKEIERGEFEGHGKDLLTILVKAGLETNATKSMTKQEILNQVPTFLIAAHESTATAVVWTLWSLSQDKAIQNRLREELMEKNFDHPTMEDLNSFTYLDWVVRETLRLHSVGAFLERAANEDDVLPFDTPFVDKDGNTRTEMPLLKGDIVRINVRIMNTLESLWGPDNLVYNPSRWENPPKITENIPGIWGNQVSFLTGPKACLGFRFAVLEMKALLYILIRAFEFEPTVPEYKVIRRPMAIARPMITDEKHLGSHLPMRVKRLT
ncbi:cytochrome P450 [Serendipita vermifera]|nr:cytochrome P450 [Serendipita vermifera]